MYTKSYSQTLIESFIFEFTWEIDQFLNLSKCIDTLCSPLFPETAEYKIQMNILRSCTQSIETQFYLLATKAFTGLCSTTIMFPGEKFFSSNSTSCHRTSKSTLLIKINDDNYKYKSYICTDRLKLHCKLEIFYKLTSDTTHMNLQPSSTVFSKDIRSLEDSTLDKSNNKLEDKKSINFIIGYETYVISKKLLHATNSSYFKNICLTHKGEEKDMTNELTNERRTFQEMLAFIQTGSNKLSKSNYEDYNMLKSLLTTADKYDVPALKLTCEHYLLRYVTVDNATELVQLAFSSNAKFLEAHLATFIKFHIKKSMNTKKLQNLLQESSNKILELIEKCKVSEITDEFLSPAYKE